MATIGMSHTLADLRKILNPQGQVDNVMEILSQDNPILEDCRWIEGNLPTGNKTTVRASLPSPNVRRINKGVPATKGTTEQIQDVTMILEDRSMVDTELLALAPNPQAYRKSEDDAHIEGMAQYVAATLLYGDPAKDADTVRGFFARYNTLGGVVGSAGHQVISAGTPSESAVNTSMLFVDWGDQRVTGIYPRGTQAGLRHEDLGIDNHAKDKDGNELKAMVSWYQWKFGLAVHNVRSVSRLCNINPAAFATASAADEKRLIDNIIVCKNRIWKPKNTIAYVSESVYTFLEQYLTHKDNVWVTREEIMGQLPLLRFAGIPVKKVDCLVDKEAAVQ